MKGVKVIGLTGGAGTGKSTVSSIIKRLGARIIDADEIARTLLERGEEGYNKVVESFGRSILDPEGDIDRRRFRCQVFGDPGKREVLDRIIHPLILERLRDEVAAAIRAGERVIVVDAALIVEKGRHKDFEGLIVVYADRETQIKRLIRRDGITREEAEEMLSSQMPIEEKKGYATFLVDNRGSLKDTERQVKELYRRILHEISRGGKGP